MSRLSEEERDIFENAIYLPMLLTVLDEAFTEYNFYFNGYHEVHRYFNHNLRNNTEKLLNYYFLHRHLD